MRIIPYELLAFAPDMSLTALRKELPMYDFCLNKNLANIAMQPFLDLQRNYFNLLLYKWVTEMNQRNHYVNSLFNCYVANNKFQLCSTPNFLIIECCLQWDLKGFSPHNTKLTWYEIINSLLVIKLESKLYEQLCSWYTHTFMRPNKSGLLKPQKINMKTVYEQFTISGLSNN